MNTNSIAFNFDYIPLNINKLSIKVFKDTKVPFSWEYAIFEPNNVQINLYPVKSRWFYKNNVQQGLATIQQFASSMGLHPDFHKVRTAPIHHLLELTQTKFQVDSKDLNSPIYYCGGVLATRKKSDPIFTNVELFTDDLLEILTEKPIFAYVQFLFKSIDTPRKFKPVNEDNYGKWPQVRSDIQQERLERRFHSIKINNLEEVGFFEFSPRIIVVENDNETLLTKLNRLAVLFISNGFNVSKYPTFWKRFSFLKKICLKRKIVSPNIIDGYSLMNFIAPPQSHFSHKGYTLVPNKSDYSLSFGITKPSSQDTINIGVPIISGKTTDVPLILEGRDLCRHIAVYGMTGEGKSRFIYGLLKEFYQKSVKFLIFDPKGEYLQPIKSFCSEFIYLKPGSDKYPWGINIFQIPKNDEAKEIIPIEDHIQFVASILENIFENSEGISPQMRRLLHLAVIQTIEKRGDFRTFLSWVNKPEKLGIKGTYLENTSAGIVNRIEKLFFGNIGRCFTVDKTTFEISELLSRNVVIDLSMFESMEDQRGRQIFLDVVFQYLYYYVRSFRAPFKEESLPKNVVILDEIQKLIPKTSYRTHLSTSMIGRGPWTLRAYDVSMIFIGTEPIVEEPMLTNTGILAIFYTNFDAYKMANLLGIPKQDYEQLRKLLKVKYDERRCIVSIDGTVSLVRTHNFPLDMNNSEESEKILNSPLQNKLLRSYHDSYFNPIREFKTN